MARKYPYSQTVIDALFDSRSGISIPHHIAENDSMHQLDEMKDSAFDTIRQNKDFIEIEEKLKKYAKKR